MKISWHKTQSEDILITCPICGHQAAPPKYPYCPHTIFVHVSGSGDDPFFDYMRSDFADAYKKSAKKPNKKTLAALDMSVSVKIIEVTESESYYPNTVIVAYEHESGAID